ncbi:MAG: zinc ribbon domain-containing protein, partial [Candidatus Eisenbacteria bacterium]
APAAVTRLVDRGLQPFMVASSLVAAISMRLIRLLCPKCKDAYVPTGDEVRLLGISHRDARDLVLYKPVGCEHCNETGYWGRTGVFEILEMSENVRRLVAGHATESLIRRAAMEDGMVSIGQDGLARVLSGETSLEEVQRVVFYEEELGHVCGTCRHTVASDHLYCPQCGTPSANACTSCGRRVDAEWGFCPSCGHDRAPIVGTPPPAEEMIGGEGTHADDSEPLPPAHVRRGARTSRSAGAPRKA